MGVDVRIGKVEITSPKDEKHWDEETGPVKIIKRADYPTTDRFLKENYFSSSYYDWSNILSAAQLLEIIPSGHDEDCNTSFVKIDIELEFIIKRVLVGFILNYPNAAIDGKESYDVYDRTLFRLQWLLAWINKSLDEHLDYYISVN